MFIVKVSDYMDEESCKYWGLKKGKDYFVIKTYFSNGEHYYKFSNGEHLPCVFFEFVSTSLAS